MKKEYWIGWITLNQIHWKCWNSIRLFFRDDMFSSQGLCEASNTTENYKNLPTT